MTFLIFAIAPLAADPPSRFPAFDCRFTDGPIVVDGKVDEPAWKNAAVTDAFGQSWLGDKNRPTKSTRAKLLWDREHLYFSAELDDVDLFAKVTERDGMTWFDDCFEIFLKPKETNPGYYEFHVTPTGVLMDLFIQDRAKENYAAAFKRDQFQWEAKATHRGTVNDPSDRDSGWTVEGRIPWGDFAKTAGRPNPGDEWRISLCRYEYDSTGKNPKTSTISPLTKSDFHRHEEFARLRFISARESPGTKASKLPSLPERPKSRVVGSPDPPPPFRAVRSFPKLKPNFPIAARMQPGSNELLYIDEASPYAPTKLRRTKGGPDAGESETLVDFKDGVAYDLCFHPDFAANGFLYVGLNEPVGVDKKNHTRIKRYTIERDPPDRLDPKSELLIIDWPSNGHNGGAPAFGNDGMLFVSSGDGTSDSDTDLVGQDLTKLTAKVLRIDVAHPSQGKPYSIPQDNPFIHLKDARPETWAFGLRNPWRMAVDRVTGDLWTAQNGQDQWEQVYLVTRGANYGWSVVEGSHQFYVERKQGPGPILPPTAEHPHSEARSLTGGFVYRGRQYPELVGAYLYGDYSTGRIWAVHVENGLIKNWELARTRLQITGFVEDLNGEVLVLDHRGEDKGGFYALERTPPQPPSAFPTKLSETGLFTSTVGHAVHSGAIPYEVAVPFWSDGADKHRWIVLPPGGKITQAASKGWNFPDHTTLVKSFSTNENGKTRWIETRLLTKQDGEWHGYSYRWNEEQTDAELASAAGLDESVQINGRAQIWRFPSRTECMMCHSRAANYVLGLSDVQMNLNRAIGGTTVNQLDAFEAWGLFEQDVPSAAAGGRLELVNPNEVGPPLETRVRSWLHANCSFCHVKEGGGNARLELDMATAMKDSGLLNVKPMHPLPGMPNGKIVAPGKPHESTLLERIKRRPPQQAGGMPPLSSHAVDELAAKLIEEWILSLPKGPPNG